MNLLLEYARQRRGLRATLSAGTKLLMEPTEFETRLAKLKAQHERQLRALAHQDRMRARAHSATEILIHPLRAVIRIARRRTVRHVRTARAPALSSEPDPAPSFLSQNKIAETPTRPRRSKEKRSVITTAYRRTIFA